MQRIRSIALIAAIVAGGLFSSSASAQWEDPEAGYTQPAPAGGGQARAGGTATDSGRADARGVRGGDDGIRLGFQARLSATNILGQGGIIGGDAVAPAPWVTAGLRFLEQRLFLGLGIGFFGVEDGPRGFSISPVANFDLLRDDWGALYLAGWFNMLRTTQDGPGDDNDRFHWGLNFGIGVRGHITPGLAIGSEWGWGFMSWDARRGPDDEREFRHGIFGTLLFEATIGL